MTRSITHGFWRCTVLVAALLAIAMGVGIVAGCSADKGASDTPAPSASGDQTAAPEEFVLTQLEGYPHDVVPLYEVKLLDTVYYSVRNDPQWSALEGGLRNIYHSVYESNIPAADVLEYYRGLCDTVDPEYGNEEMLKGTIGEYTIWLNTGFHNDKNMVYLSVDEPKSKTVEENKFYTDYPEGIVEAHPSMQFFEEMYYDSIVSGSDIWYDRHFEIADLDGDDKADLRGEARLDYYEERYSDKEGFEIDRQYYFVKWIDGEYTVQVAFNEDSNRGVIKVGRDR